MLVSFSVAKRITTRSLTLYVGSVNFSGGESYA